VCRCYDQRLWRIVHSTNLICVHTLTTGCLPEVRQPLFACIIWPCKCFWRCFLSAGGPRSPLGSGEHSQILGRISPGRSGHFSPSAGSPSWAGSSKAGAHKWPGGGAAAAAAKQVVDRACSPLIMGQDGSPPPGELPAGVLRPASCVWCLLYSDAAGVVKICDALIGVLCSPQVTSQLWQLL
jgi:hypothetical protein